MKNKEIRGLIFIQIITSILIIILSFFIGNSVYEKYKEEQIINNAYLVGSILNKYPELEKDVINSIVNPKNYEKGLEILTKYDLDDKITLDYINNNIKVKENISTSFLVLTIVVIIIITLINALFIKKIYKKIGEIDLYMNDILNGNYHLDIKDYQEGDISNLKYDTYKMTIKLREQRELLLKEKIFLTETLEDISHQIKTPLTSMYVINDVLEKEKDEIIKKDFLNKNKKQLERIEWLITSLLTMARLDSGKIKLKKEKVNLENLLQEALEPLKIVLELKKIDLKFKIEDINIKIDHNWTKEAISNIIKNASEHTKSVILIEATNNPLYVEIRITDDGDGINKKDLPYIFDRFYKGEHNKESIGIGLNMSRKIVNLQNGIIEVKTGEKGTVFILKFYKNNL